MASGRPLSILSSLDEAEEWHKQPYIHGLPIKNKKFKPFGLDPPPPPRVTEQHSGSPLVSTHPIVSIWLYQWNMILIFEGLDN